MQTHVTFQDYSGSVDPPEDESGSETPNGKRSRNLVEVDLPNAELLRLHAALARVMHLSGAGEMFPERASRGDSDEARGGLVGNYGADFVEKVVDERIADLRHTLSRLLAREQIE